MASKVGSQPFAAEVPAGRSRAGASSGCRLRSSEIEKSRKPGATEKGVKRERPEEDRRQVEVMEMAGREGGREGETAMLAVVVVVTGEDWGMLGWSFEGKGALTKGVKKNRRRAVGCG
ncbi:hypothetical protein Dda_0335 [Drechslerella dactyloides]|uniref:Uncharacterized protein n=1 Tax=Drechslerella dactyloides TaxID=74499 RepID=A0AAD6J7Q7_DREDA|nr:hypothetical protein Dda_0335 [Drechslerella dactyloides]